MSRTKGSRNKHKKEKPVKEKKKRGRPSKQHQQQQQKQTINVNIGGSGGGGGGGGGEKQIPVPYQLPFDPSLITPNYGINDRQPSNPLIDATKDIMTPLMQSIISNQMQKVDRIPVKDAVKPINPVIPEPIPQAIPIPQKDQSHPIPPELITNMDLPIPSKQTQQKLIKKTIKPQSPPEPTPSHDITFPLKPPQGWENLKGSRAPKKINDPEGLGKRIPIENIGAIAGNIGAAALTGGATAAGEALLMGGTAGLMSAGESILGASIGAGVAGGVSTALGNSTAGHIISSIAGGIAGRAAGRRMTNRVSNGEESQPLLSSRQGERLGGRRGRNRIVEPETQISRDPQTGETTTWQIPPEQSQPSLINRTVQSLRNRAQNLSDTVENIRHQITGRITNARRGRYARLSTNEPIEQHEPAPAQSSEPPIHDVTNEIMPLLHRSATRIQRLNRAVRQRRANTDRAYQEQISREFDENMMRTRNEELQRNQDAMNELDQILRQDALQQSSATRIQSAVRNRRATNETIARATRKKELNDAATTIQSAVRNRNALNETISRATRKNELNNAASTIQKVLRGHKSRKEIPGIIEEHNLQQIIKKVDDVEQKANKINNAAVTIQGAIKGHKARKAIRDQQPKFKADYTDEEFKTKEIKKLKQLQQKTNKSEIEHTLFNALKTKYTGVQLKQPSEDLTKSISTLQATIKRGHIQPLYKAGLTNARATSTLQAGIKRAHIQPLYNEGLTNFRAARTIQGAIRNRTAKRDMMKQRQLVGEAELRQMEAAKGQAIKDEAAKKLQATTKRIRPQNDLKQIRQAKEKIGAAAKSLLTEKVNSSYSPTINKTAIWNKNTVGQPLTVNKRFKLVSKKRHDAAVAGYENRAAYLDMAEHYKTIMTKGKK